MEARLARYVALYSWLFLSNTNTTKVGPRTWDTPPQNCIECAPLVGLCMAFVWPRIFCPLGFVWPLFGLVYFARWALYGRWPHMP